MLYSDLGTVPVLPQHLPCDIIPSDAMLCNFQLLAAPNTTISSGSELVDNCNVGLKT